VTAKEEKILFSNTAGTQTRYQLVPFQILSLGIIVFFVFRFYAEVLIYGIKVNVLLKIIIFPALLNIMERYFSPICLILTRIACPLILNALRYLSPFVQLLFNSFSFSKTFHIFFRIKCAIHFIFNELDFCLHFVEKFLFLE